MASEEHDDDCCPNYVPMNMAKSAYIYCVAENKRLLEENENLKEEIRKWKKSSLLTPVEMIALSNLKTEVEAIRQEYSDATIHYNRLHNDLQAQVDRLTKEGDKMANIHRLFGFPSYTSEWEAAKEVNQK
jgi:predicted  nucleic acid-binding Zn-ribbon protein